MPTGRVISRDSDNVMAQDREDLHMAQVSIGTRAITCGKCGSELSVHKTGTDPQPYDRVVCPVHGDVGTFEDIRAVALDQFSKRIGPSLSKALGVKSH